MEEINNSMDVIDSRDILERIKELEEEEVLKADEQKELDVLLTLKEEAEQHTSEFENGESLIRESYWVEYVEEMLKDIGYISHDFPWFIVVDWEQTAENIAQDYSTVNFDGVDYYIRNS